MAEAAFSGRIEGAAKASGAAVYEGDVHPPGMLHAVLVEAPITSGRVTEIDGAGARVSAGFADLVTRAEAEALRPSPYTALIRSDEVHFADQAIALVAAETLLQAQDAAARVVVTCTQRAPVTSMHHPVVETYAPAMCGARAPAAILRGEPERALVHAAHVVRARYETAANNHHPMEPHVAVCWWEGDHAVVHTCTQAVFGTRGVVTHAFGLPPDGARVVSRLLGGGFGCKGALWFPWLLLTMLAARRTGRPVRLELTRAQMFTLVGRRSATVQDIALAADIQGRLTAVDHRVLAQTSTHAEYADPVGMVSQWVYRCPDVSTAHRLARTNEPHPVPMRGPGEAPGSFALESAMDELAERLDLDPVELRLRNIADHDQVTDLPWTSNSLAECLRQGAERFGWRAERAARGWREGGLLIGQGLGVASYPARRQPCAMRMRLDDRAVLTVECGTQDMGSGTLATMAQMAAEAIGLPIGQVEVLIGDTLLPPGPISAGSQVTQSFAPALAEAAAHLKRALISLLPSEADGSERTSTSVRVSADGQVRHGRSNASWSLDELLTRSGLAEVEGYAEAPGLPAQPQATGMGFGAVFAEVEVDPVLAALRVRRVTAAFAAGRIVNPTLARSQYVSGLVGGIGMALHEEVRTDERSGRIVGPNLAEYITPTYADMPSFDIHMVDEVDEHLPGGIKGVGMLGHVGSAAAVANALAAATGGRVRRLPIRVEDVLAAVPSS